MNKRINKQILALKFSERLCIYLNYYPAVKYQVILLKGCKFIEDTHAKPTY